MPCFHTHWLVALKAISAAPEYIQNGCRLYRQKTQLFRDRCIKALSEKDFPTGLKDALDDWHKKIREADGNNDITCFSAYMLGACGPDFWMLPSLPTDWKGVPAMAHVHFDLGHYNRTHRQLELSVERVGGAGKDDLQTLAHRSYFLGMATHIAADLVIHQLVNVTAGAYSLLESRDDSKHNNVWEPENGGTHGVNIFNTHNKVEHFWDTYVRYRYLGDHGPFWPKGLPETNSRWTPGPWDDAAWPSVEVFGFSTVEGLRREAGIRIADLERQVKTAEEQNQQSFGHRLGRMVGTVDDPAARVREANLAPLRSRLDTLKDSLEVLEKDKDITRFSIEKPLMFPWLIADRILGGKPQPFIYSIVVDKTTGAYPDKEIFAAAKTEADSDQMWSGDKPTQNQGTRGEWQKLAWFSSKLNLGRDPTSFNFLNFNMGPNVEQTRTKGRNVFYDYQGLGPFIPLAVSGAMTFLGELTRAYEAGTVGELHKLRTFWNLDTGLGLKIIQPEPDTPFESITLFDFVHVFDELSTGNLAYSRSEPYLAAWQKGKKDPIKKAKATFSFTKAQVFPTYLPVQAFPDIESIYEDKDDQYLERLDVENRGWCQEKSTVCQTDSLRAENKKGCREIRDRLTLCFRAAIADLKMPTASEKIPGCEDLALFFLGDKAFSNHRLLWPVLEADAADHWTLPAVAALTLLAHPGQGTLRRVLARLRPGNLPMLAGLARALELAQAPELDEQLRQTLYRADENLHACLFEILAERRVDPGPLVAAQLGSRDVTIARAALLAVRHCPNPLSHLSAVRELLESSDARLAVTAVETGLLLGIPVARSACLHWASAGDPHALLLVALIGSEREQEVVFRALGEPSLRVAALRALGFVGTERAADAALPFLGDSDKAAARLAGETFAAITGWDLQPGAFAASDDDAGEIPGALPELDPVATSAWWKSARSAFAPGGRYLRGERRPAKDSEAFIAQLPMRLRNVVLLELALRKSRSLPVSTRSWAWQQQAQTCSLLG